MNAETAIKRDLLDKAIADGIQFQCEDHSDTQALWDEFREMDEIYEYKEDFRCSGEDTGMKPVNYCRSYENEFVARQLADGNWVGWDYWHGGGKHGNPGEMEWMEDAVFLDMSEQEVTITKRTFTRKTDET